MADINLPLIEELGFGKVLEIPFVNPYYKTEEAFYVFWRGGLLLRCNTFDGKISSGFIYYNWTPHKHDNNNHGIWGSGCWHIDDRSLEPLHENLYVHGVKTTDPIVLEQNRLWKMKWNRDAVWAGNHCVTWGIKVIIASLEAHGKILERWRYGVYMHLMHYGDKIDDYENIDQIIKGRFNMLPEHVKNATILVC